MPGLLERLRRMFAAPPPPPPRRPSDPRLEQDPWLATLFAELGDRYQLGADESHGTRVLRRTARARFNPMQVWLRSPERLVRGEYEVRGGSDREAVAGQARTFLDGHVATPLKQLGLLQTSESVEDWAGTVLTRAYEGRCEDARAAAAAVKFLCEGSEQQINLEAEG